MNNDAGLKGKVALITGGSRGLGRAMSIGFANAGASVVVASRKLDACENLVEEIRASGGTALALRCHVGEWDTQQATVDTVIEHFGRLDILINNAGMSPLAPSMLETSEQLFDKVIGINLKGPFRLSALAADRMRKTGGGSIINISSIAAIRPTPLTTSYSAAKAGLNAITSACAQEFGADNIRVNCIVCGTFETDATAGFTSSPEAKEHIERQNSLGRIGQADEIVGAALYLASDAASFTTGTSITIDGGTRG